MLSTRAWKAPQNRAEVQDFYRLGSLDYSQYRVEASADGCLMIRYYSMELREGALVFPMRTIVHRWPCTKVLCAQGRYAAILSRNRRRKILPDGDFGIEPIKKTLCRCL